MVASFWLNCATLVSLVLKVTVASSWLINIGRVRLRTNPRSVARVAVARAVATNTRTIVFDMVPLDVRVAENDLLVVFASAPSADNVAVVVRPVVLLIFPLISNDAEADLPVRLLSMPDGIKIPVMPRPVDFTSEALVL